MLKFIKNIWFSINRESICIDVYLKEWRHPDYDVFDNPHPYIGNYYSKDKREYIQKYLKYPCTV